MLILRHVCARAHACVREKLLPAGKFMPMSVYSCHAALPAAARLRSRFHLSLGSTLAKSSLNEVFSSVRYGRHPGLWFSKVTAEGKEKKKGKTELLLSN